MEIWIDAQMSPSLALWMSHSFRDITAKSVRSLGLRNASDEVIFHQAKSKNAIIMTKDSDFIKLLERFGPPPKLIWVTAGNTSNSQMRQILTRHFFTIVDMLRSDEVLIEIGDQ